MRQLKNTEEESSPNEKTNLNEADIHPASELKIDLIGR
jgi:hypothetical protein